MTNRRFESPESSAPWPLIAVLVLASCGFVTLAYLSPDSFSDDDRSHYLMSHYSWRHPELFLDLWGRPAYTLLASPFSQFGLRAAGSFNILVSLLSCYVAFQIAHTLGLSRPWLAAALTAVQPFFVLLSFGSLTEPLFSLLLAAGQHPKRSIHRVVLRT